MNTRALSPRRALLAALSTLAALSVAHAKPDRASPTLDAPVDPQWQVMHAGNGPAASAWRDPAIAALPPDRTGSCQIDGSILSPFSGAAPFAGSTTGMVADNFRPAGTGPVTLTAITFQAAMSSVVTAPAQAQNVTPTGFTINIYNDVGGFPGPTPAFSFPVSPAGTTPTLTSAAVFTFTFTPGGSTTVSAPITMRDYTATIPATTLQGGQCYWIEFVPSNVGTNTYWHALSPETEGDGVRFLRTRAGTYTNQIPAWGDLHFCFNFPLESTASGSACPLGSLMTCAGTTGSYCQINDGIGTGFGSSLFNVTLTGGGVAQFASADDFAVTEPTTISAGCFTGFYAGTAAISPVTDERFRLRIYADFNGVPDTSNPVYSVLLGEPGSSGSLDRTVSAASPRVFAYSFTLADAPTLQPGTYWLEIVNQSTTLRWLWFATRTARTDRPGNYVVINAQAPDANAATYAATDIDADTADLVFCLTASSGAITRAQTPQAALPLPNNVCSAAATLELTGAVQRGNTFYAAPAQPQPPRGPADEFVANRFGLWYQLTGDGNLVTITTCNVDPLNGSIFTNADTLVNVYCAGAAGCNALTWIAGNDDGSPACAVGTGSAGASTVSFPTVLGQTYYLYVYGFPNVDANGDARGPDRGLFFISASTSGSPADPPAVPCSTLNTCRIDIPAGAVQSPEACGAPTNTDNTCPTANQFTLGQWGTGTVFGFENGFDTDLWKVTNAPATPGWYMVTVRAEQPVDLVLHGRGACSAAGVPAAGPVALNRVAPCGTLARIGWFVSTPGELSVTVAADEARGNICNALDRGNRYALRIEPMPVGACCIPGTGCAVLPAGDIPVLRLTADPVLQDACQTLGGIFQGTTTVCGTDPNDPANTNFPCTSTGDTVPTLGTCCLPSGACTISIETACAGAWSAGGSCTLTPCTASLGRCCNAGFCTLTAQSACVGANAVFSANITTCFPNDCPVPVVTSVVCCRGATCSTVPAAIDCTTPAQPIVGAAVAPGSPAACNAVNVVNTPCCYADFDKIGGRTVDDIFVYLNAWFANSPFAKVGGDGVATPTIDDIFVYLNAWFAGCD